MAQVSLAAQVSIEPQLIGEANVRSTVTGGWDLQPSIPHLARGFSTLAEAREALERFAYSYMGAYATTFESSLVLERYVKHLRRWSVALDELEQRQRHTLTAAHSRAFALLRLHQRGIELNVMAIKNEMKGLPAWTNMTKRLDEILDYAATVVESDETRDRINVSGVTPTFSWDIGVITTLYTVSQGCSDGRIRQRTLGLCTDVTVKRASGTQSGQHVSQK
ncbi:MAG: hypothetical protein LQ340_004935 [Diploschistes diacapsis]|nr:MAG: hypothetical protein LQ340_004935 [Diploschistes diacapsis]